ncbi:MAG: hypothetical protein U9Q84_02195 [Thermodesulfobacteriota bacterium]|nr:hypothetical protein [Thermodesulfobacteriota bacterium]
MYLPEKYVYFAIIIVIGALIYYIRKVICDQVIKRRQNALANLKKVYTLYDQRRTAAPDLRNVNPEIGAKPKKF